MTPAQGIVIALLIAFTIALVRVATRRKDVRTAPLPPVPSRAMSRSGRARVREGFEPSSPSSTGEGAGSSASASGMAAAAGGAMLVGHEVFHRGGGGADPSDSDADGADGTDGNGGAGDGGSGDGGGGDGGGE